MWRHACLQLCTLAVALGLSFIPLASADWHGLFEYRLYSDHIPGMTYEPQPSAFEAALKKIRALEAVAKESGIAENTREVVKEGLEAARYIDTNEVLLPSGHPHKRPQEASRSARSPRNFVATAAELMLGNRRLGRDSHAVAVEKPVALSEESIRRNVLMDDTSGDDFMRRMLDSLTPTNASKTVTNGANAPGPTIPPSGAAINSNFFRMGSVTLPSYVDWASTGAATYVHFEGAFCQSCWAIAVADAVSMLWLINQGQGNQPVDSSMTDPLDKNYGNPWANGRADMSPQQICDCMGVSCCMGGWPESALEYVQLNGGLTNWADYPLSYNVNATQCNIRSASNVNAQISGFEAVPAGNITAFMQTVAMLPVITFVSSSSFGFGNYSGGVFSGPCDPADPVDHVVLITGYGTDPVAGPYWIIKNSWGPYWGEGGYMRISMQPGNGVCGITSSDGLYPVYFPTNGNPCEGTPNPCGSGTCFVQNIPGTKKGKKRMLSVARCGCPTGYVEQPGTWPTPSQCVAADPCAANPNPCGAGLCSANFDGSYSCTCPATMVIGSAADGSHLCVDGASASGTRTYTVQPTDTCTTISTAYSIAQGVLLQQNPWLNCSSSLAGGSVIVLGTTPVPAGSSTYVTQAYDTCANVAYGYGITVDTLRQFNPTLICSPLAPGTNLIMPPPTGVTLPATLPPTCVNVYNVKMGDTCATISAAVNVTLTQLTRLNPDINCNKKLSPPLTLCVGAASDPSQSSSISACTAYYSVQQGDNCPSIWNYANLTMTQFFQLNPGIRCDSPHLRLGEKVCVSSPNTQLVISVGLPYVTQPGDTLLSIVSQFTRRCGPSASLANITLSNPAALVSAAARPNATIPTGVQLLVPCPNAGSSDACGCGWYPDSAVCGSDQSWYFNSCNSQCNGAGLGYPSCTACAQACFGRVTLTPNGGYAWGCVANNGGYCLPQWDGSCQHWLNGCANQCSIAQWYGTWQNNSYWNCFYKCRGGC